MRISTIYFDVDGVVADFVEAAKKAHGITAATAELRWHFYRDHGVSDDDFWRPMGFDFWNSLGLHRDGVSLYAHAVSLGVPVLFVTSPCRTPGCVDGKLAWLARNFPGVPAHVGSSKHLIAAPCKLLIDDFDENLASFAEAGGRILRVPRPWNAGRYKCDGDGFFNAEDLFGDLGDIVHSRKG